ncbi:MAG: rhomboid family intramembrane serine protease [Planctomycetaceae bacterium]|jgi:membrane associated rhomboid family serine protease|nr:rhomboid family intramembrane serine protease [Planctomycetaceae bacterium]
MGLSDRDYFHNEYRRKGRRRGFDIMSMTVTMRIVIVNVALWLANGLLFPDTNFLTAILMSPPRVIFEPLSWYTLLTSGFVHSPTDFNHIVFNMLGLLMFGYGIAFAITADSGGIMRTDNVEDRLGRSEYFLFYIFAIIFAGIAHAILIPDAGALGASGGITAVVILYAFLYPKKVILFMFFIPMPMWLLGFIIVGSDFFGAISRSDIGIGYTAHLGGAAFAILYYYLMIKKNLSFVGLWRKTKKSITSKLKPNLKIFNPDNNNSSKNNYSADDDEFTKRLDQILDKYGKVGETGLTNEEKEFLKEASKRYRNKHK